jgi:hypothetical protein
MKAGAMKTGRPWEASPEADSTYLKNERGSPCVILVSVEWVIVPTPDAATAMIMNKATRLRSHWVRSLIIDVDLQRELNIFYVFIRI